MKTHDNLTRVTNSNQLAVGKRIAFFDGTRWLAYAQIAGLHEKSNKTLIIYKRDDNDLFGVFDFTQRSMFIIK